MTPVRIQTLTNLRKATTRSCYNGNLSSDWDHDNDCIPDEDDKLPTRVELGVYDGQNYTVPDTLYLDAQFPASSLELYLH